MLLLAQRLLPLQQRRLSVLAKSSAVSAPCAFASAAAFAFAAAAAFCFAKSSAVSAPASASAAAFAFAAAAAFCFAKSSAAPAPVLLLVQQLLPLQQRRLSVLLNLFLRSLVTSPSSRFLLHSGSFLLIYLHHK